MVYFILFYRESYLRGRSCEIKEKYEVSICSQTLIGAYFLLQACGAQTQQGGLVKQRSQMVEFGAAAMGGVCETGSWTKGHCTEWSLASLREVYCELLAKGQCAQVQGAFPHGLTIVAGGLRTELRYAKWSKDNILHDGWN